MSHTLSNITHKANHPSRTHILPFFILQGPDMPYQVLNVTVQKITKESGISLSVEQKDLFNRAAHIFVKKSDLTSIPFKLAQSRKIRKEFIDQLIFLSQISLSRSPINNLKTQDQYPISDLSNISDNLKKFYDGIRDKENYFLTSHLCMLLALYAEELEEYRHYSAEATKHGNLRAELNIASRGIKENSNHLNSQGVDMGILNELAHEKHYIPAKTLLAIYKIRIQDSQSQEEAKKLLLESGKENDRQAQAFLGEAYLFGKHGFEKNLQLGFQYTSKAAKAGHIWAKSVLGRVIINNISSFSDKEIALGRQNLIDAARAGDLDAAHILGRSYIKGENGFEKDLEKGLNYLEYCVKRKHYVGQALLGALLVYTEFDVEEDIERGISLLRESANAGVPSARTLINQYYQEIGFNVQSEPSPMPDIARPPISAIRPIPRLHEKLVTPAYQEDEHKNGSEQKVSISSSPAKRQKIEQDVDF